MSIATVGAGGHVAYAAAPANLGTTYLPIPGLRNVRFGSNWEVTEP